MTMADDDENDEVYDEAWNVERIGDVPVVRQAEVPQIQIVEPTWG